MKVRNLAQSAVLIAAIFSLAVSLQLAPGKVSRSAAQPATPKPAAAANRVVVATKAALPAASPHAAQPSQPVLPTPTTTLAAQPKLAASYYAMPLSFEQNGGTPANPSDRFLARGPGYSLFLTPSQAALVLERRRKEPQAEDYQPAKMAEGLTQPVETDSVRLRLLGANSEANMSGLDEKSGRSNYFIGSDPAKWRTNVAQYGKVRMSQVYPGVDLVFYGTQHEFEYDFVVAPGADPNNILLHADGAEGVQLSPEGDVEIQTSLGNVLLRKPSLYQEAKGTRTSVDGRFEIAQNDDIRFSVGPYDSSQPLVIDPVLSYSDVVDSGGSAEVTGVAVDSAGDAYITGNTCGQDYPATPGSFTAAHNPFGTYCEDVLVTKFDPLAATLIFSDDIGGSNADSGTRIAVDSQNSVYVTGISNSTDFPTTAGALLPSSSFPSGRCNVVGYFPGSPCFDAFALKLSADGSTLDYSTFLGGSENTYGIDIKVDANGQAYVMGVTNSSDFKPTPNGYQTTFGGGTCPVPGSSFTRPCFDVFVVIFSADGSQAKYSTFAGGNDDDDAGAMAIDAAGNVYLGGGSCSTNFPWTKTFAPTTGTAAEKFVYATKINTAANPASSGLVYAVAIQGGQSQGVGGIAIDGSGDAYITGATSSPNFPTVAALYPTYAAGSNSFNTNCGVTGEQLASIVPSECGNAFVTKIDAAGQNLLFSTFLGGTGPDGGASIAYDPKANTIWVTGSTDSTNFPTTANAYYSATTGAFLSNLSADGSQNLFTTVLGANGSLVTGGASIAVDSSSAVYVVGPEASQSFPITPGVYPFNTSTSPASFLMKFSTGPAPALTYSPTTLTFPITPVGGSNTQPVMLQNTGTVPMQISVRFLANLNGISTLPSSDFGESDNCGSTLAASAQCTIQVTYTPTALDLASQNGVAGVTSLTILDNAPGAPHVISLSAQVGNDAIFDEPVSPIVFSPQAPGTSSQPLAVVVQNMGANPDVPLTITNVVLGGPNASAFSLNPNPSGGGYPGCLAAITANFYCEVTVTFSPAANSSGTLSATLTFTDNAADTPQTINISGAVASSPVLTVSPTVLPDPQSFVFPFAIGNTQISPIGSFTISNPTANSIQVSALTISGTDKSEYSLINGCNGNNPPFTLAAGGSCVVGVNFLPATNGPDGAHTATISITTNPAISGLPTVSLQADAVTNSDPDTIVFLSPNPINVGGVIVGHTLSSFAFIQIFNEPPIPCANNASTCGGPLNISAITAGLSDFTLAQLTPGAACPVPPVTIASSGDCAYLVNFTPTVAGTRSTQLTILSNDPKGPFVIPVSGTGVAIPIAQVTPTSISFGPQATGSASQPAAVTVSNIGPGSLTVSNIVASPNFAIASNNCTQPLATYATCTFNVTVTPPAAGNVSGTITITDNAAYGGQQLVTASASGVSGATLTVAPSQITFGNQVINTTSPPQVITLSNSGNATVTLNASAIRVTQDFLITANTCGNTLSAGASCTVTVEYKPTTQFFESGSLLVASNAPGSPQSVFFSGQGIPANGTAVTTSLASSLNPSSFGQVVTFVATVNVPAATQQNPFPTPATGYIEFFDGATEIGSVYIIGNSQATFSTSTLGAGMHSITAFYQGDQNYAPATSPVVSQIVNGAGLIATTTTLISSANPSTGGQSVTFTATVAATAGGTPTGNVVFADSGNPLPSGTIALNNGQAVFMDAALSVGAHSITAQYVGNSTDASSSSTALSQTVNQGTLAASATAVVSSVNPSTVGQSVMFTATVTSQTAGTPTGTVTFFDGTNPLGSAVTLSAASASMSTSSLTQGSHSITAIYSGNSTFAASTSPVLAQVVNAGAKASTTTAVTSSANPATNGASVTFTATITTASGSPTGTVTFFDGATSLGTGTVSGGKATFATSSLAVGSHSITASYGGDANFSGSTSSALTQVVALKPSATALTSSLNPSVNGQSVTFTATVTSTAGGTPTGTVTFLDATTSIGTGTLNGSGVATLSSTTLATATHSITASYGGDSNFASSVSTAVSQVVSVAAIAPPSSSTVSAGQSVTIPLTLFGGTGSNLSFMLTCVGNPAKSTCTFSPNPVTPTLAGTVVQLTFATSSSMVPGTPSHRTPLPWRMPLLVLAALAALLGAAAVASRRHPRRRLAFGMGFAVVVLATVLAGCGSSSSAPPYTGTPKGASTFTVMGTSTTGNTTISTSVTVTVQ